MAQCFRIGCNIPNETDHALRLAGQSVGRLWREVAASCLCWAATASDAGSTYPLDVELKRPSRTREARIWEEGERRLNPLFREGLKGYVSIFLARAPELVPAVDRLKAEHRMISRVLQTCVKVGAVKDAASVQRLLDAFPVTYPRRGPPRRQTVPTTTHLMTLSQSEAVRVRELSAAWGVPVTEAIRTLIRTHLSFALPGHRAPVCQQVPVGSAREQQPDQSQSMGEIEVRY